MVGVPRGNFEHTGEVPDPPEQPAEALESRPVVERLGSNALVPLRPSASAETSETVNMGTSEGKNMLGSGYMDVARRRFEAAQAVRAEAPEDRWNASDETRAALESPKVREHRQMQGVMDKLRAEKPDWFQDDAPTEAAPPPDPSDRLSIIPKGTIYLGSEDQRDAAMQGYAEKLWAEKAAADGRAQPPAPEEPQAQLGRPDQPPMPEER